MYNKNSSFRGSDVHPGNACNAQILDARDQRQKGGAVRKLGNKKTLLRKNPLQIDEMKRFMWEGMMFGPIGTIHRPHLYGYGIRTYQQYVCRRGRIARCPLPVMTVSQPNFIGTLDCNRGQYTSNVYSNLTGPGIGCEIFWANGKAKSPEIDIYVTMAGTIIG
ncbi:hypothetical protein PoMZ_01827 [Pyricularia oryzae]|uniref:Uncharacterized protein n=1 Tax=Pyricularia oryzae TaxID=318829 RepID=A0A4P7N3B4_PYROR|nr:hypothetical protein PoMZ_01827 [Pyricularia oryzae]